MASYSGPEHLIKIYVYDNSARLECSCGQFRTEYRQAWRLDELVDRAEAHVRKHVK